MRRGHLESHALPLAGRRVAGPRAGIVAVVVADHGEGAAFIDPIIQHERKTFVAGVVAPASASQSVTLEWDADSDPDVAGYLVLYGTRSGVYDKSVNVGLTTSASLPDLKQPTTYFAAVVAYDYRGVESLPSDLACDLVRTLLPFARQRWADVATKELKLDKPAAPKKSAAGRKK